MKIKKLIFLSLALGSSMTSAWAVERKVITVSGGAAWASPGDTQAIYFVNNDLSPIQTFRTQYVAEKETETMGTGEIFFALEQPLHPLITGQLGVAIGGTYKANLHGLINIEGALTNSTYQYRIHHGSLLLKGKLMANQPQWFAQPYITGAIGGAFNKASGFRTTPLVNVNTSPRWFKDNTESFAFTYNLGVGMEKSLNFNWRIGLGYEFSDWGKTTLGIPTTTQWNQQPGPKLSHVFTNSVLLNVSYVC